MNHFAQIIGTSVVQAFRELKANKLRTFLSLLGITIGIFCIISVLTVLESMQNNIRDNMASLGSDVLYINRKPWMAENGEYKWWEYLRRQPLSQRELNAIREKVHGVEYAALSYSKGVTVKYKDQELSGTVGYAVTNNFDKIQTVDIAQGRYLSFSEIDGGVNVAVIGAEVYERLFRGSSGAINKSVTFMGRKFAVVGILKRSGQNMAGFNFDNAVIYSFNTAKSLVNTSSLNWNNDPLIMVKARDGVNVDDMQLEAEGALRAIRKVKPGEKNNFAINKLSQVSERIDDVFGVINLIGGVIGGFSLIVGAFGIANIMFVTVKERTKMIGLKKAIGARSQSILLEFLIEAVTLCITGGLIGIAIVLLLGVLLTYGFDFPTILSFKNIFIGIGISAIVGVLSGFIPARTASRLNPVVAIRSN
ncbi:MAG: ABC transporter permease [Flavipsychrobacter sp.]